FRIYLLGYGLVAVCLLLLAVVLQVAFVSAQLQLQSLSGSQWILATAGIFVYFLIFVLWNVLRQVFVTMPLYRHFAETLELTGSGSLAQICQRDRDEFVEAEGFAEALDVGAAI
ncbi:MAG: DUF898 domain-containing protein, partial [Halocynthiibacter sp.]